MKKKTVAFLALITTILPLLIAGYMVYAAIQPNTFTLEEERFVIEGVWGEKMRYVDIEHLILMDSLPKIISRTNGSSIGSEVKGNFRVEGYGDVKLFLNVNASLFIQIQTEDLTVFIAMDSTLQTQDLFDELSQRIN